MTMHEPKRARRIRENFEQRHFNTLTRAWSDWYPSSAAAFREHTASPVKCFEVRERTADSICEVRHG